MAYPDHYLLSFGGGIRVDEIWNMNIRFLASAVITSGGQQDECARIKPHIKTWGTAAGSGWGNSVTLSYVKFNRIGPDGEYQDPNATHRLDFTPEPMHTTAPASVPNQISLVVSWMTDNTRGLASKGRVFMPVPVLGALTSTGRILTANCVSAANAAAAFLNNVNSGTQSVPPGLGPYELEANVVSRGSKQPNGDYGEGAANRIVRVRVGDVPDTQRRRRNALPETYSVSSVLVDQE